jgi:hypothetical protein
MSSRKPYEWDRRDGWVRQNSFDNTPLYEEQERQERTYLPDGRSFTPDDRRVAFGHSQILTGGPDKDRVIDTYAHGKKPPVKRGSRANTYGSNGRPAYTTDPRNPHVYSLDEYGNTIYTDNNQVYFTAAEEEDMKYQGRDDARAAKAEGARMPNTQYNSLIGTSDDPDEQKSCWEMLLECLTGSKSNRGGGYMSGDVTIEDLRSFLDSNPDIKNILLNDQCPLNPSDQMKTNIQTFMGMLESYGKEITIAQIYGRGGRKRRSKKTKKPKRRRTRRTRKH